MSAKDGQFATKEGKSRGTGPQGDQNPLAHVPLGMSPSTPNQPQPSVMDSARPQSGRYEVFSGAEVAVGEKPVVGHPRVADENVFHQEDANHTNRWLTPESKGIKVIKKESEK